jgi:hypothetical protein
MNTSKFTRLCRRIWRSPLKSFSSVKSWRQDGAITNQAAERLDRLRNPRKYLDEVNAPIQDPPTP